MLEPYDKVYVKHYLNDFLSIWILIRFYLVVRIILNSSMYADTRANRICRLYGCEPGYFYAAKCYMQESPLMVVIVLFILSIIIMGHALRICEEPLNWTIDNHMMDFSYYMNCWWCIIITMTTVGYGEFYPRTIPGRTVIFITTIWGVFIVSLLVVAL